MNNTGADIAISTLGKLIDQELAAMRAASRDGNRPLYEISSTRYHAYLTAKDEITKALADAVEERMQGIRSCRSVTSWSRRICTPAICAAGGARVPSTACACVTPTRPRWRERCAPTACGVSNSIR